MIWGCMMDHVKNLMTVLTLLDTNWGRLTSELSAEQLSNLKLEFLGLENKIKSIDTIDEMNDLSKDFISGFSKVEPLEFLANIDKTQMRSGSLTELIEEIRIKIINYCVALQERINTLENTKLQSDNIRE